jgi:hypothetical protein
MTAKIQIRRDTTTNWGAGTPPTLAEGEIGLDTTLKQIKIGDGSSNWTALPWLSGTLPYYGTPSSTDLDDATNRIAGRYRFVSSATPSPTNGPFTFAVGDGIATLLVTAYGDTIAQFLSTEGDGTPSFPSKNYFRLYDGGSAAWRAWMPLSNWATGAAVGTPIECTTVNAKGIVTIADGTVAAPAIAFASDTDTGFFWKAANQLGVSVGNNEVAYFTSTQFLPNSIACTASGSFGTTLGVTGVSTLGQINMASLAKITGLGNPVAGTDAMNWQTMVGNIAFVFGSTDGAFTASNGSNWTIANIASTTVATTFTPSVSGNYDALVMCWGGGAGLDLQSAKSRTVNNTTVPSSSSTVFAVSQVVLMIAIKRP